RVDLAHVARVEPSVGLDRLRGGFRIVEVALHDLWPARQDLPIRADSDLRTGNWLAHGSQLHRAGAIGTEYRRSLGKSVAFVNGQARGPEEPGDLRRQGRAPRDEALDTPTGSFPQLREHEAIRELLAE